jgi:hypothetical protein
MGVLVLQKPLKRARLCRISGATTALGRSYIWSVGPVNKGCEGEADTGQHDAAGRCSRRRRIGSECGASHWSAVAPRVSPACSQLGRGRP